MLNQKEERIERNNKGVSRFTLKHPAKTFNQETKFRFQLDFDPSGVARVPCALKQKIFLRPH